MNLDIVAVSGQYIFIHSTYIQAHRPAERERAGGNLLLGPDLTGGPS